MFDLDQEELDVMTLIGLAAMVPSHPSKRPALSEQIRLVKERYGSIESVRHQKVAAAMSQKPSTPEESA